MDSNYDLKGMSQIMTIILTTVLGTMIAAIVGLSAGDVIPGAFNDTGQNSCLQQLEAVCRTTNDVDADEPNIPATCDNVDIESYGYETPGGSDNKLVGGC